MTVDALWTRFTRCWRDLWWVWCDHCQVIVPPGSRYYPEHYHGDYFD